MRVLAVLLVLFGVAALAISALAQQPQQQPSGSGSGSQAGSGQRHPGDYCTAHCRANEIPCGRGCISNKGGNAKCVEKVTTTCPGKP
jgi:hypothetical protein